MVTVRGKSAVKAYFVQTREDITKKLLRGAARAGAEVIADEAKERTLSSEVASAIKVKTEAEEHRIVGLVQVKGPGAYLAPWEEYGTEPHFISVDDSQRGGMSVNAINRRDKAARAQGKVGAAQSLVIGGQFVGATVFHPGARPHPFLRPSLDLKALDAVAAAQNFINSRVTKHGIAGSSESLGDQE